MMATKTGKQHVDGYQKTMTHTWHIDLKEQAQKTAKMITKTSSTTRHFDRKSICMYHASLLSPPMPGWRLLALRSMLSGRVLGEPATVLFGPATPSASPARWLVFAPR